MRIREGRTASRMNGVHVSVRVIVPSKSNSARFTDRTLARGSRLAARGSDRCGVRL